MRRPLFTYGLCAEISSRSSFSNRSTDLVRTPRIANAFRLVSRVSGMSHPSPCDKTSSSLPSSSSPNSSKTRGKGARCGVIWERAGKRLLFFMHIHQMRMSVCVTGTFGHPIPELAQLSLLNMNKSAGREETIQRVHPDEFFMRLPSLKRGHAVVKQPPSEHRGLSPSPCVSDLDGHSPSPAPFGWGWPAAARAASSAFSRATTFFLVSLTSLWLIL